MSWFLKAYTKIKKNQDILTHYIERETIAIKPLYFVFRKTNGYIKNNNDDDDDD